MEADEYQHEAKRTDRINWKHEHGSDVAILGAIGEVGSLASVIKKHQRDDKAYASFKENFIEEVGDILWYVMTIATRLDISIKEWPKSNDDFLNIFDGLYRLYDDVTDLYKNKDTLINPNSMDLFESKNIITNIICDLSSLAKLVNTTISEIAQQSCDKNLFYWSNFSNSPARIFDSKFPVYEQLPRQFTVDIVSVENDKSIILMMNGIAIGDRLTDNSHMEDGYRFHDVFHLASAAILGWSPVFRRMLKLKRKSDTKIDEIEDGARAAIIEEALINHIYDYARSTSNFLEGMKRIDLDLIKRIQSMVRGYEVAACEPWEWQDCILKSYKLFRQLKIQGSGRLVLDADKRSLILQELPQGLG